jgi:phosphoglycolate phosphatase
MSHSIIFDLDGTLVNTPKGIIDTFIATLTSMNVDFNDRSYIRSTIGKPLEEAFASILKESNDSKHVNFAVKQYQSLFKEIVLPRSQDLIYPGVVTGLSQLQDLGFKLAIATSKVFKSAEALLKAADLWQYFDVVLGADMVKKPKPNPEMGLRALKMLDVLPCNAIMVGDTTHDIIMGNECGMRTVAITYGIHNKDTLSSAAPTWVVDNFESAVECCNTLVLEKTA